MSGFPWHAISRSHTLQLLEADRHDAAEDEARLSRSEAAAYQSAAHAEHYREVTDAGQARMAARHAAASRAEEAKRDERLARAQDYRDALLRSGQGKWRTVAEVLRDARGVPPDAG